MYLKRRTILLFIILMVFIPVLSMFSKILLLNEMKKNVVDATEKILDCGYATSLSAVFKDFVSGNVSVELSDIGNVDTTIFFNPKTKRVEASFVNTKKKDSKVLAFYDSKESGISVGKNNSRFYTVDNKQNNMGKILCAFTNKSPGTAVLYLTRGTVYDVAEELADLKKLLYQNKYEIIDKSLYLLSISDFSKSPDNKNGDDVYEIGVPSREFCKTMCGLINESNGFGPNLISFSKWFSKKLDSGETIINLRHKKDGEKLIELAVPVVHNKHKYSLNVAFSEPAMSFDISVTDLVSQKEVFSAYVHQTAEVSEHKLPDYKLCASSEIDKIIDKTKFLEVNFSGKKYVLEKSIANRKKEVMLTECVKGKNICTIRVANSKQKLNVVHKESLYDTSLNKIVEIGNSVKNVLG